VRSITPPAQETQHEGSPRVPCPALRYGRPESNTDRSNTPSAERNLDNGSPFVDAWLLRGCAVLGVKLIHSRPGKPPLTGQSRALARDLGVIVLPGDLAGFFYVVPRVVLTGPGQCALLVFHDRC
jgi:hypothetical protein